MKHINIKIYGHVQGVYFRHHAKETADKLGIRGVVQNQYDGTVRIEAEGAEAQLQKFLEWCQQGPDSANVDSLEYNSAEAKDYSEFEII